MKIFDIIKYEGGNDTFIWKYPGEDFNTVSQLIVHESQEAILFMNGQALDSFGPGRYTLDTNNIPLLRHLINLPMGGESPFHCEVYFINKVEQMAVRWGTDSKVQYIEPVYGFPVSLGASGEMSLRIVDARKILLQLVGTEKDLSQSKLVSFFRAFLMTRIKTYIAQVIKQQKINIFEIDANLSQFSDALKKMLENDFAEYGVALERFFVTNIVKPEGETFYEQTKALHFRQYADVADVKLRQQVEVIEQETEAQKIVIESQAIARKRAQEGYTYQQERGFDVAEKVASNEAVAEFTNMGVGMGTMVGLGGAVGGMMGNTFSSVMGNQMTEPIGAAPVKADKPVQYCDNCGTAIPEGAAFCEECGTAVLETEAGLCSQCGYVFERPGKFCPKCGAKR